MAVTTPVDRLIQTVRAHVPGVPEEMVKLELFNTIDTFFRRTLAWRFPNDITLLANTTEYDVETPAGAVAVAAINATHNGLTMPTFEPSAVSMVAGQLAWAFTQPDVVLLANAPSSQQLAYPLTVMFALSIQRDALEIDPGDWQLDDWMYDMFFGDWINGIYASLYGMPAKPWSNPQLAVFHGKKFWSGMSQRKRQANTGFVYGAVGWSFPRWA